MLDTVSVYTRYRRPCLLRPEPAEGGIGVRWPAFLCLQEEPPPQVNSTRGSWLILCGRLTGCQNSLGGNLLTRCGEGNLITIKEWREREQRAGVWSGAKRRAKQGVSHRAAFNYCCYRYPGVEAHYTHSCPARPPSFSLLPRRPNPPPQTAITPRPL